MRSSTSMIPMVTLTGIAFSEAGGTGPCCCSGSIVTSIPTQSAACAQNDYSPVSF